MALTPARQAAAWQLQGKGLPGGWWASSWLHARGPGWLEGLLPAECLSGSGFYPEGQCLCPNPGGMIGPRGAQGPSSALSCPRGRPDPACLGAHPELVPNLTGQLGFWSY